MSARRSISNSVFATLFVVVAMPRDALAQACCSAAAAITPGRLVMGDRALVGAELRAATVLGSWNPSGRYTSSPKGDSEGDFEEDLFGTVRVFDRGQLSLLVPFVETDRRTRGIDDLGGGLGDVNATFRYDLTESPSPGTAFPGIAILIGATAPTGRSPEQSTHVNLADATGIGAFAGTLGLSVEESMERWLVTAMAFVSERAPRTANGVRTTLGTQATLLAGVGYAFDMQRAVAASVSYTVEGNARVDGRTEPDSGHGAVTTAIAGVYSLSDALRLQATLSLTPMISHLGHNQTAIAQSTLAALWSWS